MPQKRLTIRAHVSTWQGYGVMLCALFEHLTKAGIYVSLRPIAIDEQWGKGCAIPLQMRSQIVTARQPEEWELLLSSPDTVPTPGRKTIITTMYESTKMPPQYVSLLNDRSECIVVPSEWGKKCFEKDGVKKPIHVVPLGFDPDVFKSSPIALHGPCVFGVAGRTKHCATRKGVQEAINLFLRTFPKESDVRLHVKVHGDDTVSDAKDPRIKVTRTNFEPYEIAHWLRGLTAYVTLSRGEGFGLWPLQSLACGRPVIGCKYSGQADFMTAENSLLVPFREVKAQSGESNVEYTGKWAEPNEQKAGELMRRVYRSRAFEDESESVAHLTWQNTTSKLIQELHNCGVWR